jgi:predicted DNA-binding transcriptional regulator YafY
MRNENYITVDRNSPYLRDIGDLLHFTKEEAWILNRAILALDDETFIKQSLTKKLYALYDLKGVPYPVVKKGNSERVISLIRAIEDKQQVILKGYHSSNSSTVSDRRVEPFEFTLNYGYIWCFELKSKRNKLFKTARISKVTQLTDSWQNEPEHKSGETDIFRISGTVKIPVKLKMTLRAANLLMEEYPMSEEYIAPLNNSKYNFDGWVSNFEGIGRFVLGLIDEIEILHPPQLNSFLNTRIAGKKF